MKKGKTKTNPEKSFNLIGDREQIKNKPGEKKKKKVCVISWVRYKGLYIQKKSMLIWARHCGR